MPMALVIQSSEPTEGSKRPQGLVISESKEKKKKKTSRVCSQYGLISKTLFLLLSAQTSPSAASYGVLASGSGVRRSLCSVHGHMCRAVALGKSVQRLLFGGLSFAALWRRWQKACLLLRGAQKGA